MCVFVWSQGSWEVGSEMGRVGRINGGNFDRWESEDMLGLWYGVGNYSTGTWEVKTRFK